MKILTTATTFLLLAITSGCTTYSITNPSLLEPTPQHKSVAHAEPKTLPLHIDATMSCYSQRVVGGIKETCSNKGRINAVIKHFKERGVTVVPASDENDAHITIEKDSLNGFLEGITGFANIITLGLIPLHHHDDYTVTYTDPKNDIHVTKTVRISSNQSWFSLLYSDLENTNNGDWKHRAEQNLIRSVLDEANIK